MYEILPKVATEGTFDLSQNILLSDKMYMMRVYNWNPIATGSISLIVIPG